MGSREDLVDEMIMDGVHASLRFDPCVLTDDALAALDP